MHDAVFVFFPFFSRALPSWNLTVAYLGSLSFVKLEVLTTRMPFHRSYRFSRVPPGIGSRSPHLILPLFSSLSFARHFGNFYCTPSSLRRPPPSCLLGASCRPLPCVAYPLMEDSLSVLSFMFDHSTSEPSLFSQSLSSGPPSLFFSPSPDHMRAPWFPFLDIRPWLFRCG